MEQTKHKTFFGKLLVEYGLITEDDLEEALTSQKSTGQRLGEVLVSMGKITDEDVEWILAKQLDIPLIIVDDSTADAELLKKFPRDFLMVNRIIPMYETETELAIVTDDPLNTDAIVKIEEKFSKGVALSTANGESIDALLNKLFRREGSTEVISLLEKLFERLSETCLYRLDFLVSITGITINAFGFGILKNVYKAEFRPDETISRDDIFKALETMDIGYLYEEYKGGSGSQFSVYPMGEEFKPQAYPAVLGNFGLALPEDITFTDLKAANLKNVFTAKGPVDGYDFFTGREYTGRSEQVIQTIDSAPAEFRNCYVKAYIPRTCPSCGGGGCPECSHIGLLFKLMDGIYSYNDIMTVLKQV
jgi:hypothetical protein